MQSTAEMTARNLIEKDIKRFEQMRDDSDQAIENMREEIGERETLRAEYAGVVNILRRSLNRF